MTDADEALHKLKVAATDTCMEFERLMRDMNTIADNTGDIDLWIVAERVRDVHSAANAVLERIQLREGRE